MSLKETYNKIAHDWYNEVVKDHWWENGLNKFVSLLKKGDKILDVGCGPGITAKFFCAHGFKVLGIDFSEKMIKIAKKEVPSGNFLVMDLNDIGSLKDNFDGIYMQNVLLHIPKKGLTDVLSKIMGLLKKEGCFYISVKEKKADDPDEYTKIDNDYGYRVERFFSLFTADEIKKQIHDINLEILDFNIVKAGKTNWFQIIGKKL